MITYQISLIRVPPAFRGWTAGTGSEPLSELILREEAAHRFAPYSPVAMRKKPGFEAFTLGLAQMEQPLLMYLSDLLIALDTGSTQNPTQILRTAKQVALFLLDAKAEFDGSAITVVSARA